MRVLYVNYEGRMAGAEHSLMFLLRHLRDRVNVTVAAPEGSDLLRWCKEEGFVCESLPASGRGNVLSKRRCFQTLLCIRRIAKRVRPDIIHANNFHAMAVTSLSCGLGESRLVWHARDLPRQGNLTRWCIRRAKRIIAVSKAVKHRLVELGARNEKIDVVYNGVDPITPIVSNMEADYSGLTFSCVGQIIRWKNQEAFLDAADIVHRQYPKARFLLVGSNVFGRRDSYEAQLRRRIESQCSYVQNIGWQKDMNPIWRMTDCLVHTARMEPFGRVLIEAMAHGRPVVAFVSGGPAEIVEDGKTGFLVPFGDVQGLSEAMLRIARNGDLATSMGQAAGLRVQEHFGADKTAEGVMDVYRNVLEEC